MTRQSWTPLVVMALTLCASVPAFPQGEPTLTEAQRRALTKITDQLTYIDFHPTAVPSWLMGDLGPVEGEPASAALTAVQRVGDVYRLTAHDGFHARRISVDDETGETHVRLQQRYQGLRVVQGELIVHLRRESITGINGRFIPDIAIETRPALSAERALDLAQSRLTKGSVEALSSPELVIFVEGEARPRLAWTRTIAFTSEERQYQELRLFADAASGEVLATHSQIFTAKERRVHDGTGICIGGFGMGGPLPGPLLITEGGLLGTDTQARQAYRGTGRTYDYYKDKLGRDSYDNQGAVLRSTVHIGFTACDPNNAAWMPSKLQMVYGDGDGVLLSPLTADNDVTAHEMTHAVTSSEADLVYEKEPGALNEAFSDVMGETIDTYGTCTPWTIGENVFTPGVAGDALRYMYDPTQDGASSDYYPDVADDIADCTPSMFNDNCGVHTNSGIANLAFQLLAEGGTHPQGKTSIAVPGVGIDTAANIFYRALNYYMTSSSGFSEARKATAQAAYFSAMCGTEIRTALREATHDAWAAVGVPNVSMALWALPQQGGQQEGPTPPGGGGACDFAFTPKGIQLLRDPSFGTTTSVWKQSRATSVITDDPAQPGKTGAWKAWMGGKGQSVVQTLHQQTSIPSVATSAVLTFYLHIDSADASSIAHDTLSVEIRDCGGNLLGNVATFSNLDKAPGYALRSFDLSAYKGQVVRVHFKTTENGSLQTSFVIDDVKLTVK
jgi:Zn-dependent metalloprotease